MFRKEFKNKPYLEIIKDLEDILQYKNRKLLSVFDLDMSKHSSDLDEAILNALLNANETSKMIELCLFWNRVDIAKKYIFTDEFRDKVT
jgi:hypothetical protein